MRNNALWRFAIAYSINAGRGGGVIAIAFIRMDADRTGHNLGYGAAIMLTGYAAGVAQWE